MTEAQRDFMEPWRYVPFGTPKSPASYGCVQDDRDCTILGDLHEETARRVIACVNACRGIPTERLTGMVGPDAVDKDDFVDRLTNSQRFLWSGPGEKIIEEAAKLLREQGYTVTDTRGSVRILSQPPADSTGTPYLQLPQVQKTERTDV